MLTESTIFAALDEFARKWLKIWIIQCWWANEIKKVTLQTQAKMVMLTPGLFQVAPKLSKKKRKKTYPIKFSSSKIS